MITSRNNKLIVETAKLKQKKNRDREEKFLIDGKKLLSEALNNGVEVEKIFVSENYIKRNEVNFQEEILEVSNEVLDKLSSVQSSEGIVAIAKMPSSNFDLLDYKRIVILENIQDPGNLGTIIRTADAAGYELVICSNTCSDFYSEKTLRASMGSIFHIPVVRSDDLLKKIRTLRDNDYSVIGTSLNGKVLYLNEVKVPEKFALVFGNEANGITDETLDECNELVKIPIYGKAESLNVSIAAGILLYAYIDQNKEKK